MALMGLRQQDHQDRSVPLDLRVLQERQEKMARQAQKAIPELQDLRVIRGQQGKMGLTAQYSKQS
jgi:hypothetical protein